MQVEVKVPEVGESITEGVLVAWTKKSGDFVGVDEDLFELETDKVTVNVAAEKAGRLEILTGEDETVTIGQVVGRIDTSAADGAPSQDGASVAAAPAPSASSADRKPLQAAPPPATETEGPKPAPVPAQSDSAPPPSENGGAVHVPPSLRRLMREHRLDPGQAAASVGRVTRADVIRNPSPVAPASEASSQAPPDPGPGVDPVSRQTREKISPIRKRIAERLVESQKTTATLTTFNEVDMTNMLAWRARHKEGFKEKHGVGLGFMSFFVKAVVEALKAVPEVNRQLEGEEFVQNHYYDIGVAVSSEKGLVVPVIRNADRLGFAGIESAIADLATKVRERKIQLSDLSGAVFTISNGGVFGSLLSTPILNPPQSGVLGMHGIKKRPIAVGDQVLVRPMMYLALSYDHRLVDGREAVTFLKRVVECIENPERMLLEV